MTTVFVGSQTALLPLFQALALQLVNSAAESPGELTGSFSSTNTKNTFMASIARARTKTHARLPPNAKTNAHSRRYCFGHTDKHKQPHKNTHLKRFVFAIPVSAAEKRTKTMQISPALTKQTIKMTGINRYTMGASVAQTHTRSFGCTYTYKHMVMLQNQW